MTRFSAISLLFACQAICFADSVKPLLLQKPTINRTHIVFAYAGDLWRVSREGGDAERLTAGVGTETDPLFSPDGAQVAFTGEYDGNVDVYVTPATGGVPGSRGCKDGATGFAEGRMCCGLPSRVTEPSRGRVWPPAGSVGYPQADELRST